MNTIKTALSVLGERLGDGRAFSLNGQGKRRFRVKPGSLVKDNGTIPVQVWSDEYQEWVAWQCVRPEVIFHGWGSCDPVIETNGHVPTTTAVENPTKVKPPTIEQKEPTTNRENEALLQLFGGRTKSEKEQATPKGALSVKEQPIMPKNDIPFIPPDEPDSAWDEEDVFPSDEPEEEEEDSEEEDEVDEDDEPQEDDMDDEPSEEELEELEAEASRLLKEASRAESGGKALPNRESVPTSPTTSGKGIPSNSTVIYQDWRPAVCWCTPNQILQVDMPTLGDIQYQVRGEGETVPFPVPQTPHLNRILQQQKVEKRQQRTAPAVRTPAPTANGAVNSETGKKETMRLRVFKALARKPMSGKEIANMLGLPNPPMFVKDEGVRDIPRVKRQKFQDDRAVVFSLTEQGYKDLEAGKVDSNRAPVSTGIPWQQGR